MTTILIALGQALIYGLGVYLMSLAHRRRVGVLLGLLGKAKPDAVPLCVACLRKASHTVSVRIVDDRPAEPSN